MCVAAGAIQGSVGEAVIKSSVGIQIYSTARTEYCIVKMTLKLFSSRISRLRANNGHSALSIPVPFTQCHLSSIMATLESGVIEVNRLAMNITMVFAAQETVYALQLSLSSLLFGEMHAPQRAFYVLIAS